AGELAQELGHAPRLVSLDVAADARGQLLLPHREGLACAHAGGAAHRGGDHPEGGPGAERIAAADPDLDAGRAARAAAAARRDLVLVARPDLADQLVAEAALPDPGGRRDQRGASHALARALGEGRLQGHQLPLATDA